MAIGPVAPTGRATYTLDFPGELVGANGSGRYALAGLTFTAVTDPRNSDRVHQVLTGPINAAQWVGGAPNAMTLLEMWHAAETSGALSPFGFYVAELNRLERVSKAL